MGDVRARYNLALADAIQMHKERIRLAEAAWAKAMRDLEEAETKMDAVRRAFDAFLDGQREPTNE